MVAKTLSRLINQVYVSRAIVFKETKGDSTITLVEYVYETILNRYGILKNSEKKFLALMAGCQYYKHQSSRIRLFGRLLGLYDDLGLPDLRLYLEIVDHAFKLVLNFQIQDTDELPLVPA